MNDSFIIDGAMNKSDYNFEFNDISNLSAPDNLSFVSNISHNGNKTINIINATKRYHKTYHTVCIHSQIQISDDTEANSINKSKIIQPTHKRWWLKVPVELKKGKKLWIRMLGDSAADKPCANYNWAVKYFRDEICIDKEPVTIFTGGGVVKPKYCIWLSFPAADGSTFSTKFVLLQQLPAPILADMNILEEFGYVFKNEIPPVFKKKSISNRPFHHPAQPDLDIDLKEGNTKFTSLKVNIEKNWRNLYNLIE